MEDLRGLAFILAFPVFGLLVALAVFWWGEPPVPLWKMGVTAIVLLVDAALFIFGFSSDKEGLPRIEPSRENDVDQGERVA